MKHIEMATFIEIESRRMYMYRDPDQIVMVIESFPEGYFVLRQNGVDIFRGIRYHFQDRYKALERIAVLSTIRLSGVWLNTIRAMERRGLNFYPSSPTRINRLLKEEWEKLNETR